MEWTSSDILHAMTFARHATDIHLYEKYLKSHPDIFRHVEIETRPATRKDYYVPSGLENEAIVVSRLEFNETGCRNVGCFPYKENLESCDDDPVRWIRIGKGFGLACQPVCHYYEQDFDTRYDGRCYLANIYKKLFALLPEKVFGMNSKHNWHKGLDVVDGHLALNDAYCRSFGLDFEKGDCTSSIGQQIGEILLGSSIFRSSFTARNISDTDLAPIPPVPTDLPPRVHRRSKRTTTPNDNDDAKKAAVELAGLAADLGIDVGVEVIAVVLKKHVPAMLSKVPLTLPVKSAMLQAVMKSHLSALGHAAKMMGSAASALNVVLFLFTVSSLVMDAMDVFEYNKVFTKRQIDAMDYSFDVSFYGSEWNFKILVTPDYVWEHLEDQTENYLYYAERVERYLTAIHPKETVKEQQPQHRFLFDREPEKNWDPLSSSVHSILVFVLLFLILMVPQYIPYFVTIIFIVFVTMYYQKLS